MKEKLRAAYEKIHLPEELEYSIESALRRTKRKSPFRKTFTVLAATLVLLVGALNLSPVFAASLNGIPVIGDLARLFTFRKYQYADKNKVLDVTVPHIELSGNAELQNRINLRISTLIDREVEEATARAEEYFSAVEETGERTEDYIPLAIDIGYEMKCSTSQIVSFLIYKTETLANAYQTNHYYNIDLESGRDLTLRDLIGSDYQETVTKQIKEQIKEREDLQIYLFDDVEIADLIDENRSFYIAADGKTPVIVFEKYEIAAGAAGIQEFPITLP